MIFHLCEEKDWHEAQSQGVYKAASLTTERFIHLSSYGQILTVANHLYKKAQKPILLVLDNNHLHHKELKWEGVDNLEFPHLYRPIQVDEVLSTIPLKKNSDGAYVGNNELAKWAQVIQLDTKRLGLREFQLSDVDSVHSYASDPENLTYMVWGPNSKKDTHQFFSRVFRWQSQSPRFEYHFAVIEKQNDNLIGACNISIKDADRSVAEIGYIIRRSEQGKGYGTEFSQKLIQYSFSTLKVEKVEATCDEKNAASLRVMQKLGLKKDMVIENDVVNGRKRNTLVCSILKEKFFEN